MKKSELIKSVARVQRVPTGAAADQMDRAVDQILRQLRSGHPAHLPGFGTIRPGKRWTFREETP